MRQGAAPSGGPKDHGLVVDPRYNDRKELV